MEGQEPRMLPPTGALAPRVGPWKLVPRARGDQLPPQGSVYDTSTAVPVDFGQPPPQQQQQPPVQQQHQQQAGPAWSGGHPAAGGAAPHRAHPSLQRPAGQPLGAQQGLPDVHQMYHCGPRQFYWTSRVSVPEHNFGIMINAEFPTRREFVGQEVVHNDDAIRNTTWKHLGALIPRSDNYEDSQCAYLHHHAKYGEAVDVRGLLKQDMCEQPPEQRSLHNYHGMHQKRNDDIYQQAEKALKQIKSEVMGEEDIREFFSDPQRVSYERCAS